MRVHSISYFPTWRRTVHAAIAISQKWSLGDPKRQHIEHPLRRLLLHMEHRWASQIPPKSKILCYSTISTVLLYKPWSLVLTFICSDLMICRRSSTMARVSCKIGMPRVSRCEEHFAKYFFPLLEFELRRRFEKLIQSVAHSDSSREHTERTHKSRARQICCTFIPFGRKFSSILN